MSSFPPNTSIPLAILLWAIFRIDSTEMCLRQACHISIEADAVIVHATKAVSTLSPMSIPVYLVMYAFSVPSTVQGNLYNPLYSHAMPMSPLLEFEIWHLSSIKRILAPHLVRWVTERRFEQIWGQ